MSATLEQPQWGNSTVLKGDVVSEDRVPGHARAGQRLFGETGNKKPM